MATNFPSAIDTLTNPNPTDPQNSPSHAGQHSDANDAIEALQAKVGADSSEVESSHDYKIAQLETNLPVKATGAEIDTGTDDDKFATAKAIKDSHNVPSVAPGTSGNVLTSDGTDWTSAAPSGGGASLWTQPAGATRASNTTFTVTGDQTAIFKKGLIIKWQESGVDKVGMVSIPSTVSTDTMVTIIGDTMASIDASSLYYCMLGAEMFKKDFAVAGTIGATGTDIANAYYATEPMRVLGCDLQVGTVASTSGTTTLDLNKNGTTFMTSKATLAYNVASSPTPFTADTATSLALGDRVSVDIDGVTSTTFPVDLYVQLYVFPLRFLTLS